MGYMTVAVILNDQLDFIEKDPDFGKKLVQGIKEMSGSRRQIPIGRGQCCILVDQHHADHTAVLAVGGNYTTLLGRSWTSSHHTLEGQQIILKEVQKQVQLRIKEGNETPVHVFSAI